MSKGMAVLDRHLDDLDVLVYVTDRPPFKDRKGFRKHLARCRKCLREVKKVGKEIAWG